MPFADPFMRAGSIAMILFLVAVVLAGCAPSTAVPPSDLRGPPAGTLDAPKPLPPIPPEAKGNAALIESVAQCRLAYAAGSDRHLGLIGYVKALQRSPH